jgi:hypothetical protein
MEEDLVVSDNYFDRANSVSKDDFVVEEDY